MTATATHTTEQSDFLETLGKHRHFLCYTARDLSDAEGTERTTASELTIAGIIKHVTLAESGWASFIVDGPAALGGQDVDWSDEGALDEWRNGFRMLPGETLAGLLEGYEAVGRRTDGIITSLASLDDSHPLPEAPWFEKGASWSARRVLLHIIAETAQHAGHADIIRESLDGSKTMG